MTFWFNFITGLVWLILGLAGGLDRVTLLQAMNSKTSYILLPNLYAFALHCPARLDLALTCRSLVSFGFDLKLLLLHIAQFGRLLHQLWLHTNNNIKYDRYFTMCLLENSSGFTKLKNNILYPIFLFLINLLGTDRHDSKVVEFGSRQ